MRPLHFNNNPILGRPNSSGNGFSITLRHSRNITYGAGFVPTCFVFLSSATYASAYPAISQNFPFSILNQDDAKYNDHPNWAILASSMLNGIQNIQSTYGQITITSGYRSPYVQYLLDQAAIAKAIAAGQKPPKASPHRRHLHGDAVDIRDFNSHAIWQQLHDTARQLYPTACIEPFSNATDHLHVDWRPWSLCTNAEWRQ